MTRFRKSLYGVIINGGISKVHGSDNRVEVVKCFTELLGSVRAPAEIEFRDNALIFLEAFDRSHERHVGHTLLRMIRQEFVHIEESICEVNFTLGECLSLLKVNYAHKKDKRDFVFGTKIYPVFLGL